MGVERNRKLHLLWALPAVFVFGSVTVIVALWDWCAFDRGGCGAVESIGSSVTLNIVYLAWGGLFTAGIMAAAPWTRHIWARVSVGVCFGLGVVLAGILFMLSTSGGSAL